MAGVIADSLPLELVDVTRGVSPMFAGLWPALFAADEFASGTSYPSYTWHWRAHLPVYQANWITLFPSAVLRAMGPTISSSGLYPYGTLWAVWSADGGVPQNAVVSPDFVDEGAPLAEQANSWVLDDVTGLAWQEIWLTGVLTGAAPTSGPDLPTVRSGPAFTWLDPKWRAIMGNNTGYKSYFIAPFPRTVDLWFYAPGGYFAPYLDEYGIQRGRYLAATYSIFDQRLIVVRCQGLTPGKIDTAPGPVGLRRRGRIVGQRRSVRHALPAGSSGWVTVGATEYNDAPPGAGDLGASGYHFAELGTATRAGVATGVGWVAQALGMTGELPMGFKLDIEYDGRVITADKQDRGYGQGGDGTTSDSNYAIDLWDGSASGGMNAPGDLLFPGKANIKIRPHR